jgi:hypothetical protein
LALREPVERFLCDLRLEVAAAFSAAFFDLYVRFRVLPVT